MMVMPDIPHTAADAAVRLALPLRTAAGEGRVEEGRAVWRVLVHVGCPQRNGSMAESILLIGERRVLIVVGYPE